MTTETQTQQSLTQPMIWLAVAIVVIVALAYYFVW
jgi:F0F1-type ATP synthase membrane subunit b/b'